MTPLRKARLAAKMTIQEVAELISCDAGNLSRMERAIQRPSAEVAEKLAELFKPSLTEIQIIYPERFCTHEHSNQHAALTEKADA